MTAYNFGDILLIGFPYSDLQSVSKRPALVLYDSGDQDVLVSRITTHKNITQKLIIKLLNGRRVDSLQTHLSGSANRQQSKRNMSSEN